MKVFLSHSTKDRVFVETLAVKMKAEGFDPWRCETSIHPGDNWVGEMDRGLAEADLVLLIWSPAAAESFATKVEWTSALAREISEKKLRLGVVMLEECALPELLRTKQFTRSHIDTIAWLKARRDAGRRAGAQAPVYLPDYRPQPTCGGPLISRKCATRWSMSPARFYSPVSPATANPFSR
jgi:hypothetical protein